jgi:hypothetical protein
VTRIVIELPDQHKHLALALQTMAEHVERLGAGGADGKSIDYARIEREIGAAAAAVERAAHQGLLAGLDLDVDTVVIDGARHTRVGRYDGAYHTMAGSVSAGWTGCSASQSVTLAEAPASVGAVAVNTTLLSRALAAVVARTRTVCTPGASSTSRCQSAQMSAPGA